MKFCFILLLALFSTEEKAPLQAEEVIMVLDSAAKANQVAGSVQISKKIELVQTPKSGKRGLASLIVGTGGVITSAFITLAGGVFIGVPLLLISGIVALVLGIKSRKRESKQQRKLALWGIILGGFSVVTGLFLLIAFISLLSNWGSK